MQNAKCTLINSCIAIIQSLVILLPIVLMFQLRLTHSIIGSEISLWHFSTHNLCSSSRVNDPVAANPSESLLPSCWINTSFAILTLALPDERRRTPSLYSMSSSFENLTFLFPTPEAESMTSSVSIRRRIFLTRGSVLASWLHKKLLYVQGSTPKIINI